MRTNIPHNVECSRGAVHQAIVNAKLKELASLRAALARYHSNGDKRARRYERANQLIEELRALGHPL